MPGTAIQSDTDARMRFEILGTLRVWRDDIELDLGPRQQRLVLAFLLAKAGQPVPVTELTTLLWAHRPPASAANMVHQHVGRLRRLLEPGLRPRSAGQWIVFDAAGYRMIVGDSDFDLLELRRSAVRARSSAGAARTAEAMAEYEVALALWRGPCAGAAALRPESVAAFHAVDDEYAGLTREAADLSLRCNNPQATLGALRHLADLRPFDEALQARLLLALSTAGQRAEAMDLYQKLRHRLADELGVDPGDEVQAAFREILQPPPTRQQGCGEPKNQGKATARPCGSASARRTPAAERRTGVRNYSPKLSRS